MKKLTKQQRENRLEFLKSCGGSALHAGRLPGDAIRKKMKSRITLPKVGKNDGNR